MNTVNNPFIKETRSRLGIVFQLADALAIAGVIFAVASVYKIPFQGPNALDKFYILITSVSIILFNVLGSILNVYRSWRFTPFFYQSYKVIQAWFGTAIGVLAFVYLSKLSIYYSRVVITSWLITTPILLIIWRAIVRWCCLNFCSRGSNNKVIGIAGAGVLGIRLSEIISQNRLMGMRIKGFYDDFKEKGQPPSGDSNIPVLGDLEDMIESAKDGEIQVVYIALPLRAEARMRKMIRELADTSASVYLVPDVFIFNILQTHMSFMDGIPIVGVFGTPFSGISGWYKRISDVVISLFVLTIMCIPMLFIGFLIKLTSPGPALFKQTRYGIDGYSFDVFKFRTMTVQEDGLENCNQCTKQDTRVTRLGSFLRRTSLDELPQFFNVILGDMSVVGPRPHAVAHNEYYRNLVEHYMLRAKVRPGITGWAQICGYRGEIRSLRDMEKRVEYDLFYIRNWSIWLDLRILLKTVLLIFFDKKAY